VMRTSVGTSSGSVASMSSGCIRIQNIQASALGR
jgi:hypothetical protein